MKRDQKTVNADGEVLTKLPLGISIKEVKTHVDDRGMVCEMFDPRWGWHDKPMVFSYFYTIRPGHIKGWGLHKKHEDRYFVMFGELELVFYDEREESPTKGLVSKVYLSEYNRCLINIPVGIWHASKNIGSKDLVVVNFPTAPYNHDAPDKYRLPINTDQIPYKFEDSKGW